MKKMYIQPEMMVSPVAPQTIICTSTGEGDGGTNALGPGKQTGDAPARDPKVF